MQPELKYSDDTDKAYGLAGMAIAMVAMDGERLLESMSLDAAPGEAVRFTPDFYFSGNPRLSARIAWYEILKHFQLSTGMIIGNVMCRSYVGKHCAVADNVRQGIYECVAQEGHDSCSLDDDEIQQLFSKSYNEMHRMFIHSGVQAVAREFATTIGRVREMSRGDVIEQLRMLSML